MTALGLRDRSRIMAVPFMAIFWQEIRKMVGKSGKWRLLLDSGV